MSKKTVLQEVNDYIKQIREQNAADQAAANQGYNDAAARASQAEAEMKAAIDKMDMTAYEAAKAEKEKAESAMQFYAGRQAAIYNRESVREEKRVAVVNNLLAYEKDLSAKFDAAILPHVQALEDLYSKYAEEIQSVESTMTKWVRDMCPVDFLKGQPDEIRYHVTMHYWKDFLSYAAHKTEEYCDQVREGDPAVKARERLEQARREQHQRMEEQEQARREKREAAEAEAAKEK